MSKKRVKLPKLKTPHEKYEVRHCSICGAPGHTKALHEKKRPTRPTGQKRPTRKNVEFFTDGSGVHPVRDSAGYTEWLTGSMKGARQRAALKRRLRGQAAKRYSKR